MTYLFIDSTMFVEIFEAAIDGLCPDMLDAFFLFLPRRVSSSYLNSFIAGDQLMIMAAIRRARGTQRSTELEIDKFSPTKRKIVPTKLQKRQVRQRMLAVMVPAGVTS